MLNHDIKLNKNQLLMKIRIYIIHIYINSLKMLFMNEITMRNDNGIILQHRLRILNLFPSYKIKKCRYRY